MLKMLKETYYNGKAYKFGEECNIDPATEERWIKNKIAEKILSMDFSSMSDDELVDYAEKQGIDIARCKTREGAISKLEKALHANEGESK